MELYPVDGNYILANKRAIKKKLLEKGNFLEKKIAILSGTTVGEIKNILELFLLDYGIKPEFLVGDYGRFFEEAVFEQDRLREFGPDIIFVQSGIHNLDLPNAGCSVDDAEKKLENAKAKFSAVWDAAEKLGAVLIQNNFEYPRIRPMGNFDAVDVSGKVRFVSEMNAFVAERARTHRGFYLNDINYLSAWYGLDKWSDPSYYNSYKYQQAPEAIPYLCKSVADIIKSIYGKNQKALMLDLDNTLWGGVIGDDGVEGIAIGTEAPGGIAYLDMQKYAKELTGMGVVLGVVSKNEDKAARSGFDHPSSVLKTDDFAVFLANWNDKAGNIQAAAKMLNIGVDALVFADDNPAEREIVRAAKTGAEVPELDTPERFAETVARGGYFEVTSLSDDDRKRAQMYKQNAQRAAELSSFADYGQYLDSLEMTGYIKPFTEGSLERVTALANKTNQFNLTTRRYTAEEMEERMTSDRYVTLSGRLEDKFGDNGIVTEIIGDISGDVLDIELWIMSCRVFKRELEYAMFDELVAACRAKGIKKITGSYYRTVKNPIVAEFYGELGFTKTEGDEDHSKWEYIIPDDYVNRNTHMEVKND